MNREMIFQDRQAFHEWLENHAADSDGIWLIFGKKNGPKTLSAAEALEEALCFGWIDGQMQSLNDTAYKKYFAHRTVKSKWSDKNKKLTDVLIQKGLMTGQGYAAIEQAKKNGAWDAPTRERIADEQIEAFRELVRPHEPAYSNLLGMTQSVQRTYTGYYLDTKSEATRLNRLNKIIERLDKNLKPM